MKNFKVICSLLLLFAMLISGCSSGEVQGDNGVEEASDALKVAVVLPGTINDAGWSAAAYEGVLLIQEEMGADIAYNENTAVSDYDQIFTVYGTSGYDIVFAHGAQFADSVLRIAPDFPDTQYCLTSCAFEQSPNVSSLQNPNGEYGFLIGAVAAIVSETDVVGVVGGMEIPSITNSVIGYEAGAKYINPDIDVRSTYTGNFEDANSFKEISKAMIEEGADVLFHNGGNAGNGLIEAAQDAGVYALGCIGDQAAMAPETIITSAVVDLQKSFLAYARMTQEEGFAADNFNMGMKDGAIYLAPYYEMDAVLSDEQKSEIETIVSQMLSGELDYREYGTFDGE